MTAARVPRGVQVEARDCAPDCDERDTCADAGKVGHWQCGHCDRHHLPRHHCGDLVTLTDGGAS